MPPMPQQKKLAERSKALEEELGTTSASRGGRREVPPPAGLPTSLSLHQAKHSVPVTSSTAPVMVTP